MACSISTLDPAPVTLPGPSSKSTMAIAPNSTWVARTNPSDGDPSDSGTRNNRPGRTLPEGVRPEGCFAGRRALMV